MALDLQQKPLMGHTVPRIFTPPLRDVDDPAHPEYTHGWACIWFAEHVLGLTLDPWQKWLLRHALEVRPDGSFRFRNVVVLVARQNGKSTLSQVLALYFLYALGTRLVLGTAQDLDTATEVWQGAVDMVMEEDEDESPVRPELRAMVDRIVMVNGQKSLNLITKARYKVKAASRRSGRGLSGDLVILDELREHQTFDAWSALTGTTNARPNAQIWALSNAGDVTSVVLRFLRMTAHAALGDPDGICAAADPAALLKAANESVDLDGDDLDVEDVPDDTLGLFEWSAPPGCHVKDRKGWAYANPSLGYGRVTERTLQSKSNEPEWVWRTEGLCQWADGTLDGFFPAGAWDECRDRDSRLADDSPVVLTLDVSWDRSAAHVGIVGLRDDGLTHVEVLASSGRGGLPMGTDWVLPWLQSPERSQRVRTAGIVAQTRGAPVSSMVEGLEAAGLRVIPWGGGDLGAATGFLYDLVREGKVRHRGQPVLDVAAATALPKPMGDSYVVDRKKSPNDAAPLVGMVGGCWFLSAEVASAYDVLDSVM